MFVQQTDPGRTVRNFLTTSSITPIRLLPIFKTGKSPRFSKQMLQMLSFITQSGIQGELSMNAFMFPRPWVITHFIPSKVLETGTNRTG
jgi:hypothetical protein